MTERSSLYQYAIQLNNEGIQDLIINHDERSAIAALSHSLQIFKQLLILPTMVEDEHSSASGDGDGDGGRRNDNVGGLEEEEEEEGTRRSVLNHATTERLTNCKPNEQDVDDDECCPIFDRAVTIQPHQDEDIVCCTGVVVFNIALIYHCRGTRTCVPSQHAGAGGDDGGAYSCIIRATKLYEMALQLVLEGDTMIGSSSSSCRTSVLIQLASVNNLIRIRMENANYKGVQDDLDLLPLLPSEVAQVSHVLVEDPQLQHLFSNLLLVTVPIVAAAA